MSLFIVLVSLFLNNWVKSSLALQSPSFTITKVDVPVSSSVIPARRIKILVSNPAGARSHSAFVGAIADTLAEAGHEVHILTYIGNAELGNFTGSKMVGTIIRHERPIDRHNDHCADSELVKMFFGGHLNYVLAQMWRQLIQIFTDVCQELVDNRPLLNYLKEQHYDFALAEPHNSCIFGIFKMAEVPAMAFCQSMALTRTITVPFGIPSFISFVPNPYPLQFTEPLKTNYWGRIFNFVHNAIYRVPDVNNIGNEQPIFDKAFGTMAPRLATVMKNVSLAFVNTPDFFSTSQPLSGKIINVAGIDDTGAAKLPNIFIDIIKAAPRGVVLFSLGSILDTRLMPVELINTFATAFGRFSDHTFIWKLIPPVNATIILPPNVHIFDWVPQKAILAHPKTKVFISHCGLNSVNEAAKSGVPVLGVPLFGDHPHHAALLGSRGLGINIYLSDIRQRGPTVIEEALRQLLNDEKYARAGRLLKRKLSLTPFPAKERLVRWVEFAAEFPDLNELNMPTSDEMSWIVYYSLDVIGALAAGLLALIYVFVFLCKTVWRLLCGQKSKSKKE